MRAIFVAAVIAVVVGLAAANAPGSSWSHTPAAPCPNPVCVKKCTPICKVSTIKCTNTSTTTSVCNFKCAVPEEPKVIVTPLSIPVPAAAPTPGRKLQGDDKKADFKTVGGHAYGVAPTPWVPVVTPTPAPVVAPPKPPPLPVCSQSCTNVTGFITTCAPTACSKLVDKTRPAFNCSIQCEIPKPNLVPAPATALPAAPVPAPGGRRLKDASYSTPVAYASIPNAPAVPAGQAVPVCQQVCVEYQQKYQEVECVSDDCKDQTCIDTDCSCPNPPPPPAKTKAPFSLSDIPFIGPPLQGIFGGLLG